MARGIWKGAVSFGLLNIPIELMSAKEEKRLSFNLLDRRDNAPIGYKQYNKKTGKEVKRKDIVKGYEYDDNEFVLLEKEDFVKANPKATQTIDIEDFVDLKDLDFLLFERPYYLVPGKNGEKGYMLLRKVLEETNKVAVAKFVLRNTQHLVTVIPKGDYLILEVLRFSREIQEVHEADYLDKDKMKRVKISAKELKVAKDLVQGMTTKWQPDAYKDTYQSELLKYIKNKIKKGDTEVSEPIEETAPATASNVVDLMPLLKKSLASRAKHHSSSPRKKSKKASA